MDSSVLLLEVGCYKALRRERKFGVLMKRSAKRRMGGIWQICFGLWLVVSGHLSHVRVCSLKISGRLQGSGSSTSSCHHLCCAKSSRARLAAVHVPGLSSTFAHLPLPFLFPIFRCSPPSSLTFIHLHSPSHPPISRDLDLYTTPLCYFTTTTPSDLCFLLSSRVLTFPRGVLGILQSLRPSTRAPRTAPSTALQSHHLVWSVCANHHPILA